jgi:hypothetical protein
MEHIIEVIITLRVLLVKVRLILIKQAFLRFYYFKYLMLFIKILKCRDLKILRVFRNFV